MRRPRRQIPSCLVDPRHFQAKVPPNGSVLVLVNEIPTVFVLLELRWGRLSQTWPQNEEASSGTSRVLVCAHYRIIGSVLLERLRSLLASPAHKDTPEESPNHFGWKRPNIIESNIITSPRTPSVRPSRDGDSTACSTPNSLLLGRNHPKFPTST